MLNKSYLAYNNEQLLGNEENVFFSLLTNQTPQRIDYTINPKKKIEVNKLSIIINFEQNIQQIRTNNYRWQSANKRIISNTYTPKILRLENGIHVVASKNIGCWEFLPEQPKQLSWHFYKPYLQPTVKFDETRTFQSGYTPTQSIQVSLLVTSQQVIEWSRTPIGFVPTICFTDHCDFDTLILLEKQRLFFKKHHIKISKGFFMYHFSKRNDNVGYDQAAGKVEIDKWKEDGHELVYHSLSQSIKSPLDKALDDFYRFTSTDSSAPLVTWIDHGYQPYNFSSPHIETAQWVQEISKKQIQNIWNYLDSADADFQLINQLDADCFSPAYLKKVAQQKKRNQLPANNMYYWRNLIFYHADPATIQAALTLKTLLIALKKRKKISLKPLLINVLTILKGFAILFRQRNSGETPLHAAYAPLIFRLPNSSDKMIFQTLAVKNFDLCFHPQSIDKLVQDAGVLIAHTYFAFLGKHHTGKMFMNPQGDIAPAIENVFDNLGQLIQTQKLWNPTLSEMVDYYQKTEDIELGMAANGEIKIINAHTDVKFRKIT